MNNIDYSLEGNVIGNILLDINFLYRLNGIEIKHFGDELHRRVFGFIQDLEAKKAFSMTRLMREFESHDRSYIITMSEDCVPGLDANEAFKILQELWENRETVRYLSNQLLLLEDEKKGAKEVFEAIGNQKITQERSTQHLWAKDAMEECAIEIETWNDKSGMKTGLCWLDEQIKGLFPADLVVVGGLTGKGKTALAATIAFNVANDGHHVLFFSMEMTRKQLTYRILSRIKGKNVSNRNPLGGDTYKARLAADIRRIAKDYTPEKFCFMIDDTPSLKLSQIRQRIMRSHKQYKLNLVVIDFLTLMTPEEKSLKENRTYQLDAMVYEIKAIAKELGITAILLCQQSREAEKLVDKGKQGKFLPKPQLSHFRETGGIGFVADVAIVIHDPAPQEDDPEGNVQKRKIELYVLKNRYGSIGKSEFIFNGPLTTIENLP